MTDDEIRIAVAEELGTNGFYAVRKAGYYYRPNAQGYTDRIEEAGRYTKKEAKRQLVRGEIMDIVPIPPPNYPHDLNACHEMEATLGGGDAWREYWATLLMLCDNSFFMMGHARACKRCEAFLRVRGKWIEG